VVKNASMIYKLDNWLTRIIAEREYKHISIFKMSERFLKANTGSRHFWKPLHLLPIFKVATYYGVWSQKSYSTQD
jgi:hypothetical protein